MRGRSAGWTLCCSLALLLATPAVAVEYRLRFTHALDASHLDDPTDPISLHFTALVGATHAAGAPLWEGSGLATPGIEDVAEQGDVLNLFLEVDQRISEGAAGSWILARGLFDHGSSSETTFEATRAHPHLSLISMIAPSPDWFVGISDVSLIDAEGRWIDALSFALRPWDAGTEEGSGFSLNNPASVPHGPITPLLESPFAGRPAVATLEIVRISPVPEPGTGALLAIGLAGMAARRRRAS